ncbi:MAG TPA: hypothetical protein VLB82_03755 [Thermodesulfobacteriota bacterium]|nr:hypothetical protein [Thermodesulfobacteriota bacterium]
MNGKILTLFIGLLLLSQPVYADATEDLSYRTSIDNESLLLAHYMYNRIRFYQKIPYQVRLEALYYVYFEILNNPEK